MGETDPYPAFVTLNLTQLGKYFGTSPHIVGKWLKEIGLRGPTGEPTPRAIDGGVVKRVMPSNDIQPFWAWHKEKSLMLLESAGHRRICPQPESEPSQENLIGPFSVLRSDPQSSGFEISDSTGVTGIWVRGEVLATRVTKLLNLCHQMGKWFK
jgi:hypothetical protein